MTFIDLFSGIGGFRLGMEQAGHTCLGHVEKDKFCNTSYEAIYKADDLIGTDIIEIPSDLWREYRGKVDCICGGFPCQAFSIAGYQKGFKDTRGTLFFEILRAVKEIRPQYIFLENVKNLLSHNNGESVKVILNSLEKEGYHIKISSLNTMFIGNLPQNRERVYIVAFKEESSYKNFNFPNPIETTKTLSDFIDFEKLIENKYYYTEKFKHYTLLKETIKDKTLIYQWRRKYIRKNKSYVCPTLTANMGTGGHNVPLIFTKYGIRKLTPKECWKLQGFPDWAFDRAKEAGISNSQLYKQAGNSVTVNVIKRIAKKL